MQVGDILDGKYRLARKVRSGGMGAVYAAERLALGDLVAVKVILPGQDNPVARARFLREARAAAYIRHPNVVQIFDFGDASEAPYLVMELLEGHTLDEEIAGSGKVPIERAVDVVRPVCSAVEAGHRRGILHRDLKPGNIMLARMDDAKEVVKVLDFGLARFTDEPDTRTLTTPGSLLGTYSYMSPEQILDEPVGPASDVYALGVILFEMLAGRLPFRASSAFALMDKIVAGRRRTLLELAPEVSSEVAALVESTLARDPGARPASADELGHALSRAIGGAAEPVTARTLEPVASSGDQLATTARHELRLRERGGSTNQYVVAGRGLDTPEPTVPPTQPSAFPRIECFVDRETELEALKSEYHAVRRGEPRTVIVTGDAGAGKTALARAFGEWAATQGARVLTGRFFDYEGDRPAPFGAFVTMLAATRVPGGAVRTSVEERLAGAIGGTRGDAKLGDEADKWRAFATIATEFEALGAAHPLVLVFDDLQWAGAIHLELLAYLRRNLGRTKTLVVATARDAAARAGAKSDLAAWLAGDGGRRASAVIGLKPFVEADIRAWFAASFGKIKIRPLDVRRLAEATGGNPYYLREMVRHLLANGTIVREGDEWRCASLDDAPLPETVTNAVHAQLTGLDDDLRKTLEIAAVIGDHFRFDTLLEAARVDEETLESLLEQALHRQLLADDDVAPPDDYRFYHRTIRVVLYAGLSKRRRRKLHERVVQALERVYGDRLERIAGALCYHHHAVGKWGDALRWGVRAGEDALGRCDLGAAETHLGRAHDAVERMRSDGESPPLELGARLDLLRGTLAARLGRAEEARALLKRVAEEASRAGALELRADALYEVANCELARGDLESAVAVADDAARVADEAGDRLRSLQSRVLAGSVLRRLGRTSEAERAFDAILADLDESDPPSLRSFTFQNLAWLRAQVGAFREAGDMAGVALELARAARDPLAEQQAFSTLAFVRVEMGDAAGALALHQASLDLARSFALRRREGIDLANVGEAHYLLERSDEALGYFEEALAIFAEIGDRACEGDCRVNLGRALLASGRIDEALESLDAGIAICRATGRREYEAVGHYYVGVARRERGEPAAARIAYARAKEIFLDLGWHDAWRPDLALAKCAIAEGDREGALASVLEGLERLARARAQLPPTADFARYAMEIEELERLRDELGRYEAEPE